ncbi:two-partner secretion domain-containing protein [Leptothoe sp. PORK10 BA2]|uniref:two-partner secretion domain-containing protein n=1 Tax=Leptothoe sp. PORK10 BA2 TaxID=3110254 RepID=UPI002B1FBB9E|nr:filamentous hemagglutinin N-terminal domain-containing protein [Leptothoe sp. PORK10 BA2]MEA5464072.1 filamentous hemagglutinin N-terminal domain-containing protein [Leptothoe sp. PORK10 BA2]
MLFARPWYFAGLLGPWLSLLATPLALAQVTPDATLGAEGSLVSPGIDVRGDVADLIEGGAVQEGNLFHSFLEFNIGDGQRVYFANPVGIESILSRVTGGNPSAIFGTLGVDGAADLFLLNPNGIIFGENVALDIEGSFYASTAEAISVGSGVYSATAPEQSSLLTVNPSALVSSHLSDASGDIENRGQLAAQGNLTLAANNLDLQGQVAAGGDLTLLGNAVQIRDAVDTPFVGFAGGDLLVQGNEGVDIVALSHPDSGLYSYGDMVLRSANPVGGDAHYWSGGSFRVENLDGSISDLFSPIDPIIRAFGDVFIEDYLGSSLHILAGGAVTIGTAEITAPDSGTVGIDFLQETITLSDGTVVQIDGAVQPTLDVRAGVNPVALGSPPPEVLTGFNPVTDTFFGEAFTTETPSTADITVGDVFIAAPNGLVLLTNQYQPNPALAGGNIVVTGNGIYGDGIDARGFGGQGGAVYLDARADVSVINSFINTTGLGVVGDVVVNADGTVRFDGTDGSRTTGAFANIASGGEGTGGDVRINAANLEVLNGAQINALVLGTGQGGNVALNIEGLARFEGTDPDGRNASGANSNIAPDGVGRGGDVQLTAGTLEVLNGAQLSASTFGEGDAGSVILVVEGLARFEGTNPDGSSPSGAFSSIQSTGVGQGGDVQLTAGTLEVLNGAQLNAGTSGEGEAGSVILVVEGLARFEGTNPIDGSRSGAFSSIESDGVGTGGDVQLTAGTLEVLNGAQLDASTFGAGKAGSVILMVEGLARFEGTNPIDGTPSGAFSSIQPNGVGTGGDVQLTAGILEVLNGAQLSASTLGEGDAGSVILVVEGLARFEGTNPDGRNASGANSASGFDGVGQGGDVRLTAGTLEVLNGAQLSASTLGEGDAGNVILVVEGLARFEGTNPDGSRPSGANSAIELDGVGTGGDVRLTAGTLKVLNGAQLSASTSGEGDAGSVILVVEGLARFEGTNPDGRSASGVFSSIAPDGAGTGGDVQLIAGTLEVLNGAQLDTSTGGEGDAGNVILVVEGLARFEGTTPDGRSPSGVFSSVDSTGMGTGGDVQLTAGTLEVLNGAQLIANTRGNGDAGNVQIIARDRVVFDGSADGQFPSAALSSVQAGATGAGGNVEIAANSLEVRNGALLIASTFGDGDAGNVVIQADDLVVFDNSNALSSVEAGAIGAGGNVEIAANSLEVLNSAQLQASTEGNGDAGNVVITASDAIVFDGTSANGQFNSAAFSSVQAGGTGAGGNVEIAANSLEVRNGAQLIASTFGDGDAGNVVIEAQGRVVFDGTSADGQFSSAAFSSVQAGGTGAGGNVEIAANSLEVRNGARLSASTLGDGNAGNVVIDVDGRIRVTNGEISSLALATSGGRVDIRAGNLILRENSNILTLVGFGEGSGGNITIIADFVIALDDSDILAFSADGQGGDIDISRTTFFGQNANIGSGNLTQEELFALNGNDRVDVNASGGVEPGQIIVGDSSFIENSLTSLADTITDTTALTAGSCIARTDESLGSFTVTGSGGLPHRPGDSAISAYPTGTVRTGAAPTATLQEPDSVYQLPDGRLVLSRACE